MTDKVLLEASGAVAMITNDHPEKHNAFDDEMDARLFDILAEIKRRTDVRAVVWRAEGESFSAGRDVSAIGTLQVELTHHELMRRGHRGIQQLWELDAPVIAALKGWVMGGSFQRAPLATSGSQRRERVSGFPSDLGVIPDTGGVAVLYQMCGPGLVSDMVLTGRVQAEEA